MKRTKKHGVQRGGKSLTTKMIDEMMNGMKKTLVAVVRVGTHRHPVWGSTWSASFSDGALKDAPAYGMLKLASHLNSVADYLVREAMKKTK